MSNHKPSQQQPGAVAVAIASALLLTAAATPAAAGTPLGVWLDESGRGAIQISNCGKTLCGKVVWVKSPKDREGCGEKILGNVKKVSPNTWDRGWIFSPEHGRRFDLALQPLGDNRLRVTGYAGIKLFGESRTWSRAPSDLIRCDQPSRTTTAALATTPAQPPPATSTGADNASPAPTETIPQKEPSTAQPQQHPSETTATRIEAETTTIETVAGEKNEPSTDSAPRTNAPKADGMQLDKFLKRTADGKCRLDTPWIKVNFACKDF